MAHVGSPDTFFAGKAGPYDVRVSVRLPGVIPGRAQVAVRVVGATRPQDHRVTVRAGQWNVGLKGAPPPETGDARSRRSRALRRRALVHDGLVVSDGRRRRRPVRRAAASSCR